MDGCDRKTENVLAAAEPRRPHGNLSQGSKWALTAAGCVTVPIEAAL
jgi:hypothetical protein